MRIIYFLILSFLLVISCKKIDNFDYNKTQQMEIKKQDTQTMGSVEYNVRVFSNGIVIQSWHTNSPVVFKSPGVWRFKDRQTGDYVEITGTVIVTKHFSGNSIEKGEYDE